MSRTQNPLITTAALTHFFFSGNQAAEWWVFHCSRNTTLTFTTPSPPKKQDENNNGSSGYIVEGGLLERSDRFKLNFDEIPLCQKVHWLWLGERKRKRQIEKVVLALSTRTCLWSFWSRLVHFYNQRKLKVGLHFTETWVHFVAFCSTFSSGMTRKKVRTKRSQRKKRHSFWWESWSTSFWGKYVNVPLFFPFFSFSPPNGWDVRWMRQQKGKWWQKQTMAKLAHQQLTFIISWSSRPTQGCQWKLFTTSGGL